MALGQEHPPCIPLSRSHGNVSALLLRSRPHLFPPPFSALSPGEAPKLVQLARQPCQAAGSRRWGTAPVSTCSSSSAPRRSDRRLAPGQQRRLRALLPQPGRDRRCPGGNRCCRLRVECSLCSPGTGLGVCACLHLIWGCHNS